MRKVIPWALLVVFGLWAVIEAQSFRIELAAAAIAATGTWGVWYARQSQIETLAGELDLVKASNARLNEADIVTTSEMEVDPV